ncbi:ABC transporter permease [Thalassotalea agariperforans]
MSVINQITIDEWRFWHRTRLAATVIIIGTFLAIFSAVLNTIKMQQASHEREHLQHTSESQFLAQPDRHPHRMVHYGHYVFRAPSPLSIIEPGVDAFTGTSIFLEGHKQNSAMFADQRQASGMTRFSSLTPSFLLQVLVPLFIILIGYASITREKEAGTLNIMITQGVNLWHLILGKYVALVTSALLMLMPLIIAAIWATFNGESILVTSSFVAGYIIYIAVWSGIVLSVSASSGNSSKSFAILVGIWILFCILIPRIGSSSASAIAPSPGKLEADFAVVEELRKLGDGHNAADPAFEQLKKNLLAQYNVEKVEDLPINFRGTVAQYSEKKLTDVLNTFAEKRMDEELDQAKIARLFGWLTPTTALRSFSMTLSGTSLETHHRFLREAEQLRFNFVQSLNKAHQDILSYDADINRSKNNESNKAARIDANNWQVLSSFSFKPDSAVKRLLSSLPYICQLLFWIVAISLTLRLTIRRIR